MPRFFRPLGGKRFLITAAQNATPVHAEFWKTLQVAARHLDAELVVIPLRYKNPTSTFSKANVDQQWWATETRPYLFNVRKKLCDNLVIAGDVKTQPTASSPLTGFESLTGKESCILGHTKMQFRTVPVPTGRFPKILTTTGACTVPNYTDTKAGKLGAFHHFLGALLVEVQGKKFHLRQLNADKRDGSFIDLNTLYTVTGARPAPPALGLAMGDTHVRFTCPKVDRATFGPGGIVETLNPEALIFHDAFDGYSVNPHHKADPFIAHAKGQAGFADPEKEVRELATFVLKRAANRRAVLVDSNHGTFVARWIRDNDWRTVGNKRFFLETALMVLESVKMTGRGTEYADPLALWMKRLAPSVVCPEADSSVKLADIECGMHGHAGPNGAKGTVKNLARLGARVISGHGHSPAIEEGHYRVGTSSPLSLDYTHGPTSWLNTHCAVYANGKRSLISVIDGEWRLPPVGKASRKAA